MKRTRNLTLAVVALFGFATLFSACKHDEPKQPNDPKTYDEGVVINDVKWATRNVDAPNTFAATPEIVGMFYQWNRKIGWSSSDPIVNSNGGIVWDASREAGDTWEKANDPSPAGWRVPTVEELRTLLDTENVKHKYTTQNGVYGMLFTDLHNGNTLFLPATGVRIESDGRFFSNLGFYEPNEEKGDGEYWSSTRQFNPSAYYFGFDRTFVIDTYYTYRSFGFCVRPVKE